MSAKLTIETDEITLSKAARSGGQIDESLVVDLIVALVDAYDAAHGYKEYNVRDHLRERLNGKSNSRN